jgi:transcriptional regulator with PAS, ATPase and Fis domain
LIDLERQAILNAPKKSQGIRRAASKHLGISKRILYRKQDRNKLRTVLPS